MKETGNATEGTAESTTEGTDASASNRPQTR
jgi:hypothetical protein